MTSISRKYNEHEDLRDLKGLVIDMDGVLWRGSQALPGLADFFQMLRRRSIQFKLATNNPTLTPAQYVAKLGDFGVAVETDNILTSGVVTAHYVAQEAPGARVYVIGSEGLRQVVRQRGLQVANGAEADYVVVGLDPELTYAQLMEASLLIRAGARFVGCNPDRTLPSERGLVPGNGATLAFLTASTDVTPVIVGKPQPMMFEMALASMGLNPGQAATLGDRLETDILGGQRAGLKSILVLSGVADRQMLAESDVQPDWVFENIQTLTGAWGSLP